MEASRWSVGQIFQGNISLGGQATHLVDGYIFGQLRIIELPFLRFLKSRL